jgi:hypothetical protein
MQIRVSKGGKKKTSSPTFNDLPLQVHKLTGVHIGNDVDIYLCSFTSTRVTPEDEGFRVIIVLPTS